MEISGLNDIFRIGLVILGIGCIVIGIVRFIRLDKQGGKLEYVKVIVSTIFSAALFFAGAFALNSELNRTGEYVQEKHPISIDNITYGQALDAFCSNIKWSRVAAEYTDSGSDVIQMNASCKYNGDKRKITMQIRFEKDMAIVNEDTPFEISFIGLDDAEETSMEDMEDILYEMFLSYASEHEISLDESVKNGILYSDGWKLTEEERMAFEDEEDNFDDEEYEDKNPLNEDAEQSGAVSDQIGGIVSLEDYISYSQTADEMVDSLFSAGLPVQYWEEYDSFGSEDGSLKIFNTDMGGCQINITYSDDILYSVCGINPAMSLEEADEILLANGAVDATRPDDTVAWRYTIDGRYSLTMYGSSNNTIEISFDCYLDDLTSW